MLRNMFGPEIVVCLRLVLMMLAPAIETVSLITREELSFINSTQATITRQATRMVQHRAHQYILQTKLKPTGGYRPAVSGQEKRGFL